jgi:ABC-2 type transport system permease protein
MSILAKLTRNELRLFLREPMVVFFAVFFPTILVAILGSVPSFRRPDPHLGGTTLISVYTGIALAVGLAMLGLQFAPGTLALYREKGILRRMATTPVRPAALLAAQLAATLIVGLISGLLVIAVSRLVFHVALPKEALGYAVAYLFSAAGVFSVGLLIAALAPSGKAGNTIGTLLFFPSMFFAGLWTPREVMPHILQRIGDFTPLGAGERALHEASLGHWPSLSPLLALVAYVVVFGAAAAKVFRWE